MKNITRLLFLLLCFTAADARAQFQLPEIMGFSGSLDVRNNVAQYLVRPYRDRTERFRSARTEALQMSLAMDDESDQLTLENWADNRADIRPGSSKVKATAGVLGAQLADETDEYTGNIAGAYGRFGAVEAEASMLQEKFNSDEYQKVAAGAGFSFGGEGMRLGLHGNMNLGTDSPAGDDEVQLANHSAGAALALITDLYELGATVDYVDRGMKVDSDEVKRSGPALGGQAMIKPFKGLKAALRASFAKLSGGFTVGANEFELAADNVELGARAEWKLENLPLTLAVSYDRLSMNPEYTLGAASDRGETANSLKSAGAALRLLGGRVLLGVEAQQFDLKYDVYSNGVLSGAAEMTWNAVIGGAEVWVLPGFALRGSFQRRRADNGASELFSNILAAGAGLKGEKLSLDLSARVINPDIDIVNQDKYVDVKAAVAYKF